MSQTESFQHGFYGSSGVGPGLHSNTPSDNLDAYVINTLERAVAGLYSSIQADGMYGPCRTETVSGTVSEYFDGDGVTVGFILTRSISKFQVYRFNVMSDDPYSNGVEPISLGGQLTDFDSGTNLSNTFIFTTAPGTGTKNIKIKYYVYSKYGSRLNSSASLFDW